MQKVKISMRVNDELIIKTTGTNEEDVIKRFLSEYMHKFIGGNGNGKTG